MKTALQVVELEQGTQTALELRSSSPLDQNPAAVLLARLAKGSRPAILGALANIVAIFSKLPPKTKKWSKDEKTQAVHAFPWHQLRYQHTLALRAAVIEKFPSLQTINLHLSALRGVLKEAWRLGLMPAEQYQRTVDIQQLKGGTVLGGRALSKEEVAKIFDVCESNRDRAMVAVLIGCGPRRAELSQKMPISSYKDGTFTIRGKGNKVREVDVSESTKVHLEQWLAERAAAGASPTDPIFPVSPQGVLHILKTLQAKAGLESLSPHDCRRTYITELLDAGVDALIVSKLAGHTKTDTTRRYDRRGSAARKAAVNSVKHPW